MHIGNKILKFTIAYLEKNKIQSNKLINTKTHTK
jgi:hypothetical protein